VCTKHWIWNTTKWTSLTFKRKFIVCIYIYTKRLGALCKIWNVSIACYLCLSYIESFAVWQIVQDLQVCKYWDYPHQTNPKPPSYRLVWTKYCIPPYPRAELPFHWYNHIDIGPAIQQRSPSLLTLRTEFSRFSAHEFRMTGTWPLRWMKTSIVNQLLGIEFWEKWKCPKIVVPQSSSIWCSDFEWKWMNIFPSSRVTPLRLHTWRAQFSTARLRRRKHHLWARLESLVAMPRWTSDRPRLRDGLREPMNHVFVSD